ncbi:type II toxin-antitoxin system YafQ family toxin [Thermodesulfobacteriota bacterium]
MMKIRRTNSFKKDYRGLPAEIRDRVDKQLLYLLENPGHPSLRLKKLKGTDKFATGITKDCRVTFRHVDQILELRRVGTHDVLRKEGS